MKRFPGWIALMLVAVFALTSCGGSTNAGARAHQPLMSTTSPGTQPSGGTNSSTKSPGTQLSGGTNSSTTSAAPYPANSAVTVTGAGNPYLRLARRLEGLGVKVWFEADLVKAWLAGQSTLTSVVDRLGVLARSTHTAGFKIADELGYNDGVTSPQQVLAFLHAAVPALHRVAPGAKVLIDLLVPALGCLPWLRVGREHQTCADDARARFPAASDAVVASYLQTGLIDRVDLSTGMLLPSTYLQWGTTIEDAQRAVWQHVESLGWGQLTTLQSRRALAGPEGYAGNTARDLATFVDIPTAGGAAAVDIWTWRQPDNGQIVSLLPADLHPNPLWIGMRTRHQGGMHLITHMTPSMMPADPAAFDNECRVAAQVFDEVFVASGTG